EGTGAERAPAKGGPVGLPLDPSPQMRRVAKHRVALVDPDDLAPSAGQLLGHQSGSGRHVQDPGSRENPRDHEPPPPAVLPERPEARDEVVLRGDAGEQPAGVLRPRREIGPGYAGYTFCRNRSTASVTASGCSTVDECPADGI